jgi:recombinational DNA repair protein (RecF pathway)
MKQSKRCNRKNNYREIGNKITPETIERYLRRELMRSGWTKKDSQCYISGRTDNLETHHSGKSFKIIVSESLKKLKIEYKPYMRQYDIVDLARLKNEVINAHKSAEAITLNADMHEQLHETYGNNVTREQLEAFKAQYQVNAIQIA